MPEFKYKLDFNIAEHDKWSACQINAFKDIFDTLNSLREWTNPDRTSSYNTKVLTMPNYSDIPIEIGFKDLEQTVVTNGAINFKVYDDPDHDHARRVNIVLEIGAVLIRHQWLDPHTLASRTEIWVVDRYANDSLVRRLNLKDKWGAWTLEDKEKK